LGAATIGSWFGTGQERGIALVFTIAGLVGVAITLLALTSKYYRQLSEAYANAPDPVEQQRHQRRRKRLSARCTAERGAGCIESPALGPSCRGRRPHALQ